MQTLSQTPPNMFTLLQRLSAPLFPRAYVWREDEQRGPLWDDIRRRAEGRFEALGFDGHGPLSGLEPVAVAVETATAPSEGNDR